MLPSGTRAEGPTSARYPDHAAYWYGVVASGGLHGTTLFLRAGPMEEEVVVGWTGHPFTCFLAMTQGMLGVSLPRPPVEARED